MRFGPIAVDEATGAITAHAVSFPEGGVIRKGRRLSAEDVTRLAAAGIDEVIVARLDPADVHEDAAAARVAAAIIGPGIRVDRAATGRANLFAETAGLLVVDRAAVDAVNAVDPAITVATLPEYAAVEAGRMVATVKIIPFAVPQASLEASLAAAAGRSLVRVTPFRPLKVGVVSTLLPSLKASVVDKTHQVMAGRLTPAGATLIAERRVPHRAEAVATALTELAGIGADLLVVFGASAVVDRADVIPAGIEAAGGRVEHLGMPVDPGNLLILGELGGRPVLGAPGCARSPKENGFDWVLQRLLAGLPVTGRDIAGMGVGGLLMEIVSRPLPREAAGAAVAARSERPPRVAAVILAAGRSSRMGGPSKLLATIAGKPLVRIAAEAALASAVDDVLVVVGDRGEAVARALQGLNVTIIRNPAYVDGLSTSLRAGIAALPAGTDAALVMLADMPEVGAAIIDRIVAAFDPAGGAFVVVPTHGGRQGNPVLWSSRFFGDLKTLEGDTGAKRLILDNPDAVVEVEVGAAATLDLDTPEALAAAGGLVGAQ